MSGFVIRDSMLCTENLFALIKVAAQHSACFSFQHVDRLLHPISGPHNRAALRHVVLGKPSSVERHPAADAVDGQDPGA